MRENGGKGEPNQDALLEYMQNVTLKPSYTANICQ
jgi:hypothetical protein